jgi:putative heme utilization carrier protein HutX
MTTMTNAADTTADLETKRRAIRQTLEQNGRQMAVVLARKHGVAEIEVVRAMPEGMALELDATRWQDIIRALTPLGPCHVIVNNGSVTMECTGTFDGFSMSGPFFNVQNDELDMHIAYRTLTHAFAIVKPGHTDGVMTQSIQFFNDRGEAAFKVFSTFGGAVPSEEKQATFHHIIETFRCQKEPRCGGHCNACGGH